MHANRLLKHNIDALLKARHQTRHDLAQWCRRSDAWLSKILSDNPGDQARGLPLKYLDRIADFFGIASYQLFQPGISPLMERRKGDRRSGRDRRVSAVNHHVREQVSSVVANLTSEDVADLLRLKALSSESRAVQRQSLETLARSEPKSGSSGRSRPPAAQSSGSSMSGDARTARTRFRGNGTAE
jgi:hypothetical protein